MYSIFDQDHELAIPMGIPHVFRFRPPNENTLSELKENYIWFSDRDSLNDELDSNPEFVNLSSNPDEIKLLCDMVAAGILDPKVKNYFDTKYNRKEATRICFNKDKTYLYPALVLLVLRCIQ